MKSIIPYIITLALFAGCTGDGANTSATDNTLPADTTLPTRVDNTQEKVGQEVPIKELPKDSKRQNVESQNLSIMLPPGMLVEDLGTFMLVCSEEHVKNAQCFTIEPYKDKIVTGPDTKTINFEGRTFHYAMFPNEDGNMSLEGYIQMGQRWYLVKTVNDNPEWILPYLAHVEPTGSL